MLRYGYHVKNELPGNGFFADTIGLALLYPFTASF